MDRPVGDGPLRVLTEEGMEPLKVGVYGGTCVVRDGRTCLRFDMGRSPFASDAKVVCGADAFRLPVEGPLIELPRVYVEQARQEG